MSKAVLHRRQQLLAMALLHAEKKLEWEDNGDVHRMYEQLVPYKEGENRIKRLKETFSEDAKAIRSLFQAADELLTPFNLVLPGPEATYKRYSLAVSNIRPFAASLNSDDPIGHDLKKRIACELVRRRDEFLLPRGRNTKLFLDLGTSVFHVAREMCQKIESFKGVEIYTNSVEIINLFTRRVLPALRMTDGPRLFLRSFEFSLNNGELQGDWQPANVDVAVVSFAGLTTDGRLYTNQDAAAKEAVMRRASERVVVLGDSRKINHQTGMYEFSVPTKKEKEDGGFSENFSVSFVTDYQPPKFECPVETDLTELARRIICPWAEGGGSDRLARYWARALDEKLKKLYVVDNHTDEEGVEGFRFGAKSDGHTLTVLTPELRTMQYMGRADVTHKDFSPLVQINADPAVLIVNRDADWDTVTKFLADVAAGTRQIKMSGTVRGGIWDLARIEMLKSASIPVDAVEWIPAKGEAPALQKLIAEEVDAVFCSIPGAITHIRSGQLRALAIASRERLDNYQTIPTFEENGISCVVESWRGLGVPITTPSARVAELAQLCAEIGKSDEYGEFLVANSFGTTVLEQEAFRDFLDLQDSNWKELIVAASYGNS